MEKQHRRHHQCFSSPTLDPMNMLTIESGHPMVSCHQLEDFGVPNQKTAFLECDLVCDSRFARLSLCLLNLQLSQLFLF
jgi:hypothetical protein